MREIYNKINPFSEGAYINTYSERLVPQATNFPKKKRRDTIASLPNFYSALSTEHSALFLVYQFQRLHLAEAGFDPKIICARRQIVQVDRSTVSSLLLCAT